MKILLSLFPFSVIINYKKKAVLLEKVRNLSRKKWTSFRELERELINLEISSTLNKIKEFPELNNILSKIKEDNDKYIEENLNHHFFRDEKYRQLDSEQRKAVNSNAYSFDIFGNISSDNLQSYTFDWGNHLRTVSRSSVVTNYIYDHEGNRVEKENSSDHFIFLNKYTELKNGVPVYNLFLDNKRVALIDTSNKLSHLHQDLSNSNALRTDGLGAVSFSRKYYPFGEGRITSGALGDLNNLFTDQYLDSESDVYYFKQRYFSQHLGRFLSADPLYSEKFDTKATNTQAVNLYSYAKNNPIKFYDPDGFEPLPMDTGAVWAYKDVNTGEFMAQSDPKMTNITPEGFMGTMLAGPAIAAGGAIAVYLGPATIIETIASGAGAASAASSAAGSVYIATSNPETASHMVEFVEGIFSGIFHESQGGAPTTDSGALGAGAGMISGAVIDSYNTAENPFNTTPTQKSDSKE